MATGSSIEIRSELVKPFPDALLRGLSRECGVVRRQRKVDRVALFRTLVPGSGLSDERSFAGLLLPLIFAPARKRQWLQHHLATTLLGEAINPNKNRNSLLQNVGQGGATVLTEGLTDHAWSAVPTRRRSRSLRPRAWPACGFPGGSQPPICEPARGPAATPGRAASGPRTRGSS